tara:strand:- start:38813 stop:39769 length:957 start_codon:yes stop_codon:yes gene_type:complete
MAVSLLNPNLRDAPKGFSASPYAANNRLQVVTLDAETIAAFEQASSYLPSQSLEYKAFLRFVLAEVLDKVCDYSLAPFLTETLLNRTTGAFLIQYEVSSINAVDEGSLANFHIRLSTAISHLIGVPNFDAMYGKYYARFTVTNSDNSDSYLRKAHRRLELHNDGTYVKERTDFVLMMKLVEENIEGGESLILHTDDWQDLDKFYDHPLAKQDIQWGAPPSKNIDYKVHHPVFFDADNTGRPCVQFINQFAEPQNRAQGLYLHEISQSLENEKNCLTVPLPVGSILVIHNHVWLHGRESFVPHQGLRRELLRQRGSFVN